MLKRQTIQSSPEIPPVEMSDNATTVILRSVFQNRTDETKTAKTSNPITTPTNRLIYSIHVLVALKSFSFRTAGSFSIAVAVFSIPNAVQVFSKSLILLVADLRHKFLCNLPAIQKLKLEVSNVQNILANRGNPFLSRCCVQCHPPGSKYRRLLVLKEKASEIISYCSSSALYVYQGTKIITSFKAGYNLSLND